MKNTAFFKSLLYAGIVLLFLNCDDEKPVTAHAHQTKNMAISFSQFKKETDIVDFQTVFRAKALHFEENARTAGLTQGFVIDTTSIEKRSDSNPTYSFFVYPVNDKMAGENEIFNLVYYMENGKWETFIFSAERKTVEGSNNLYENIKQVYSSNSKKAVCWGTEYKFHCTRTGPCAGGSCDLCNLCVSSSAITVPCGGSVVDPEDPGYGTGNPEVGINPGGGGIPVRAFMTALQLSFLEEGWLNMNPFFKARLIENYIDLPSIAAVAEIREEFKAKMLFLMDNPEMCQSIMTFVIAQNYQQGAQQFGWELANLAMEQQFEFILNPTIATRDAIQIDRAESLATSLNQLTFNPAEADQLPNQRNSFIGSYKFRINTITGLKMNIKFSVSPEYHHTVANVNTEQYGVSLGEWGQSDYSVDILPNGNIRVEVIGSMTYDYSIQGWGLKVIKGIRLVLILNPADATIIGSSWHYN
ncbi:hypothetical protein D3C87_58930 [compost metagenome]